MSAPGSGANVDLTAQTDAVAQVVANAQLAENAANQAVAQVLLATNAFTNTQAIASNQAGVDANAMAGVSDQVAAQVAAAAQAVSDAQVASQNAQAALNQAAVAAQAATAAQVGMGASLVQFTNAQAAIAAQAVIAAQAAQAAVAALQTAQVAAQAAQAALQTAQAVVDAIEADAELDNSAMNDNSALNVDIPLATVTQNGTELVRVQNANVLVDDQGRLFTNVDVVEVNDSNGNPVLAVQNLDATVDENGTSVNVDTLKAFVPGVTDELALVTVDEANVMRDNNNNLSANLPVQLRQLNSGTGFVLTNGEALDVVTSQNLRPLNAVEVNLGNDNTAVLTVSRDNLNDDGQDDLSTQLVTAKITDNNGNELFFALTRPVTEEDAANMSPENFPLLVVVTREGDNLLPAAAVTVDNTTKLVSEAEFPVVRVVSNGVELFVVVTDNEEGVDEDNEEGDNNGVNVDADVDTNLADAVVNVDTDRQNVELDLSPLRDFEPLVVSDDDGDNTIVTVLDDNLSVNLDRQLTVFLQVAEVARPNGEEGTDFALVRSVDVNGTVVFFRRGNDGDDDTQDGDFVRVQLSRVRSLNDGTRVVEAKVGVQGTGDLRLFAVLDDFEGTDAKFDFSVPEVDVNVPGVNDDLNGLDVPAINVDVNVNTDGANNDGANNDGVNVNVPGVNTDGVNVNVPGVNTNDLLSDLSSNLLSVPGVNTNDLLSDLSSNLLGVPDVTSTVSDLLDNVGVAVNGMNLNDTVNNALNLGENNGVVGDVVGTVGNALGNPLGLGAMGDAGVVGNVASTVGNALGNPLGLGDMNNDNSGLLGNLGVVGDVVGPLGNALGNPLGLGDMNNDNSGLLGNLGVAVNGMNLNDTVNNALNLGENNGVVGNVVGPLGNALGNPLGLGAMGDAGVVGNVASTVGNALGNPLGLGDMNNDNSGLLGNLGLNGNADGNAMVNTGLLAGLGNPLGLGAMNGGLFGGNRPLSNDVNANVSGGNGEGLNVMGNAGSTNFDANVTGSGPMVGASRTFRY